MSAIVEGFFYFIKLSAAIIVGVAFLAAINVLLGLLGGFVSTTVFGEIMQLISMYMPFNANTVFASILAVCSGILAFKVAKKIFDLTSWSISTV